MTLSTRDQVLLMSVFMPIVMGLLFVAIGIIVFPTFRSLFVPGQSRGKRRRELRTWARSRGLTYREGPDCSMASRFRHLNPMGSAGRCARNIMEGTLLRRPVCAFDYDPERKDGPDVSAVIVRTGLQLKPLLLRPEGFLDKTVAFAGYEGVKFESADFSQQFYVSAADARWAVEALPQATIEYLLQAPRFCLEFLDGDVIAYRNGTLSPAEFEAAVGVVSGVLDRLPHWVTDGSHPWSPSLPDSTAAAPQAAPLGKPAVPTSPAPPVAKAEGEKPGADPGSSKPSGFSGLHPLRVAFFCLFLFLALDATAIFCAEWNDYTLLFAEIALAVVLLPALWALFTYNALVSSLNTCSLAWVDVDIELKRRYSLIPRLVEVVQGYAKHEREVLESVIQARNAAAASCGSPAAQARDEEILVERVRKLLVMVEGYPKLRASQQFLKLQEELENTENRIQGARRFYNNSVRAYNNRIEVFPSVLIARLLRYQRREFFEIEPAVGRTMPAEGLELVRM